jgi:predicted DNA-binding protein (UPF0251 family)
MPRPRKCKRVCSLPENNLFGPINGIDADREIIVMTVDEYETIRLIDLEGMNQEECAERMNAARTTIQRMYYDARKKLAESLVYGKRLQIEGGDYKLCSDEESSFKCEGCCKNKCFKRKSRDLESDKK